MLIMDQGRAHSILAMFPIPEGVCPLIIIQPSMLRNLVLLPPTYKLYDGVSHNVKGNELFGWGQHCLRAFFFIKLVNALAEKKTGRKEDFN